MSTRISIMNAGEYGSPTYGVMVYVGGSDVSTINGFRLRQDATMWDIPMDPGDAMFAVSAEPARVAVRHGKSLKEFDVSDTPIQIFPWH